MVGSTPQLNDPQHQAVHHGDQPLLVLAGAGTGKTMVVTKRIAHFIRERQVAPATILAVTFTNKAAKEMRNRVHQYSGVDPRAMDIGTFHGICGKLLRSYGDRIGIQRNFVIYDESDQLQLIRRCMVDLNIDAQSFSPRNVRNRMEEWKNQGKRPEKVVPSNYDMLDRKTIVIYREYEKRCLDANAVDFGDLLLHVVTLLAKHEEVRRRLHMRWTHILVDEYQDTNPVQYQLLKQLVTERHSLTVVGDDDQSIYRWRGADIGNILRFERDFPGATVVRLEQNYRSTQSILSAANAVIANNAARKGKTLFTELGQGERAKLRLYQNENNEGEAIAQEVATQLNRGRAPQDFAVLYRINAQSRPIEDAMIRLRIPYAVLSGVRFYDRKEIKDALSYLRLLINPRSTIDFLRVVNEPGRGIGKTSLDHLTDVAAAKGMSLMEAAALVAVEKDQGQLTARARNALGSFYTVMSSIEKEIAGEHPARILERVLEESGYLPALRADASESAADRMENLAELVAALDEYVERSEETHEEPTLAGYLEEVALVNDVDKLDEKSGQVTLMTLHSAKGLEFPWVFLPGMEEGIFPHSRSLDDRAGVEEERRLCYVGITRAREQLVLSAARMRCVFGETRPSELSRFLIEIPEGLLDLGMSAPRARPAPPPPSGRYHARDNDDDADDIDMDDLDLEEPTFDVNGDIPDEVDEDPFVPGKSVFHASFGNGTVTHSRGSGSKRFLTIQFPTEGRKVIAARFVQPA